MSTAEAETTEFDAATKELGDKIVGLTLLEAKKVVDYLRKFTTSSLQVAEPS